MLCGYSSYPRDYDYAAFKKVADEVGALTMADISHIGGLVAADVMRNPFDSGFDVVTTTTHKTLRGPRGGLILEQGGLREEDRQLGFPGLQGGPHMNNIAGAAITFKKAAEPRFVDYAAQTLNNAKGVGRGADRRRRDTDHRRHRQPPAGDRYGGKFWSRWAALFAAPIITKEISRCRAITD